jgi:hypothetical protein
VYNGDWQKDLPLLLFEKAQWGDQEQEILFYFRVCAGVQDWLSGTDFGMMDISGYRSNRFEDKSFSDNNGGCLQKNF